MALILFDFQKAVNYYLVQMKIISTSFKADPDLLARLDGRRGQVSRSEYVVRLLEQALRGESE